MADDKGSKKPPPLMGATAIRPPEREGMEKYTYILYDPKSGKYLTRTPKSWALIILFYCIYYSCLAGFWAAAMKIFLTTIDLDKPRWTLSDSIIGTNPGIGVRPSQVVDELDSGIYLVDLNFNGGATDDANNATLVGSEGYALRMKEFFKVYEENDENRNARTVCSGGNDDYHKDAATYCTFDKTLLGDCAEYPYGYGKDNFKPCVFLKMNRIWNLEPKPITAESTIDESVKALDTDKFLEKISNLGYPEQIFVHCLGEYAADQEILDGKLTHFPENGVIYKKYFPFNKKVMKENALVALQFNGLENMKGRLLHVICKAFYDGVKHSKKDKAGLVKFNMLLDEK